MSFLMSRSVSPRESRCRRTRWLPEVADGNKGAPVRASSRLNDDERRPRRTHVITARGLARTYRSRRGDVLAVRGVDLDVAEREIVGFLGPNGAGKTTTLRMLTTLLEPTAGEATVAGHDLRREPVGVRRNIGYVAQGGSSAPEALAAEELVDHAMLYGVGKADAVPRVRELVGELDLTGLDRRPVKTLSGGQRRRLDIAMGLVHGPRLVFLDEPTTGLDPQSRANMWSHVRRLRDERDATVFLTTHYLDEADALCDRVMVIDHGRIVAEGTPDALKRQVSGDAVRLTPTEAGAVADVIAVVTTVCPGADPTADGDAVVFRVPDGAAAL